MKDNNGNERFFRAIVYVQIAFIAVLVLVLAFAQAIGAQLSFLEALGIFGAAVINELIVFGTVSLLERLGWLDLISTAKVVHKRRRISPAVRPTPKYAHDHVFGVVVEEDGEMGDTAGGIRGDRDSDVE